MVKILILALSLLIITSCSKKEVAPVVVYTQEEFDKIINTTSTTPDKNAVNAINFTDYSAGVDRVNSKALIYERLSFAAIAFENEKQAKAEALRLNQYYSRNWLFDKVEGEPLLEDLVISRFHATNPKRTTQRKPVHAPPMEHHEGAGGGGH
jgi:hypothetical protein